MADRPTPNVGRRQALKGAGVVGGLAVVGWLGWTVFTDDEPSRSSQGRGGAARAGGEPDLDALADSAVSGGPGKDGIPSIDKPVFVSAADAAFLSDDEPVFGLVRGSEARAYPQQVLVWHEIVNDTLDDERFAVTYCPLTGTVVGFTGLPDRPGLTFGVSGRLVNSNLLMYDRETDSEWPQILGTAISGELYGQQLRTFPLVWSSWRAWRAAHPDTRVLSTDTGALRSYGDDPYGSYLGGISGYYADGGPIFDVRYTDDRFGPKDVVIGIRTGERQVAIHKNVVKRNGTVRTTIGTTRVRADWDPDLDTARVEISGDKEHTVMDAMWFAWYAFYPGTEVVA